MRFPVVLFDLDGTVVDSGGIILASMRHATRTVLGREIPEEELMAAVGGPALEAQMRAFAPERVDELVRVYRAHNEPLHDVLECCAGMDSVIAELSGQGRRLGLVSAKRRSTVELAFAHVPLGHHFEVIVGGDDTERQKPSPDPLLHALDRSHARGRRLRWRLAVRHAGRAGGRALRRRRHLGSDPSPGRACRRRRRRRHAGGAACRPLTRPFAPPS